MKTVGISEVKQFPHEVFRQVVTTGEPLDVTYHDQPVGVQIVPAGTTARRWVSAAALDAVPVPDAIDAAGLRDAIDTLRDTELVVDPWEGRP